MSKPTAHDRIAELLGAYALDAVSQDEAELVARHVEVCPRCRDELAAHREVAGLLGAVGGEAPPGLWDQIAANAHDAPPAPRLRRLVGRSGGRRTMPVRVVAAAAAVVALVLAGLGVQVARLDHQTQHLNQVVASMGSAVSMRTVHQAMATPGSRVVELTSLSSTSASAQAVVLPSGQGYLFDAKLDPLPPERTYQLWGLVAGQRISYGLLGTDPTTVLAFRAAPGVQSLAITDEVASGVESSTQPAIVVGGLSGTAGGPSS